MHGIYLKVEKHTVFDSLWDPSPSTLSAASPSIPTGKDESPSPAACVVDITDDDDSSSLSLLSKYFNVVSGKLAYFV